MTKPLSEAQREVLQRLAEPGCLLLCRWPDGRLHYWPTPSAYPVMPSTLDNLLGRRAIEPLAGEELTRHKSALLAAVQVAACQAKRYIDEAGGPLRYRSAAHECERAALLSELYSAPFYRITVAGRDLLDSQQNEVAYEPDASQRQ